MRHLCIHICFFFFNDTATTEIYTLSLHDALPILGNEHRLIVAREIIAVGKFRVHGADDGELDAVNAHGFADGRGAAKKLPARSEEHTSELQSQSNLVCRLLLEKKKHHTSVYVP